MAHAACNGIELEYECFGETGQPAILLIQGLGLQLIHWPESLCQALAAQGYRVIRFDNRDCGLSTHLTQARRLRVGLAALAYGLHLPFRVPYTLVHMAQDCLGLLDHLGIQKAHVVGASMGGMIAQLLAALYPERVKSLTSLMSTTSSRRLPWGKPEALRSLFSRPDNSHDPESVVRYLFNIQKIVASPDYPTPDEAREALIRQAMARAYYPAGVARHLLAVMAGKDRRRLLGRITCPSLVIHGEADPLLPLACGRDTAQHIPGAILYTIPGMGHDFAPGLMPIWANAIGEHVRRAEAPDASIHLGSDPVSRPSK